MEGFKVANRYADSLLELALENKQEVQVAKDCEFLLKTIDENHDLEVFLESPVVAMSKKIEILDRVFKDHLSEMSIKFLHLVTSNKREGMLELIINQYLQHYKDHQNILVANVTSAVPMDADLEKTLKAKIKSIHSGEIEMHNKVDDSLIGGFILKIKDQQIDASISRKLNDLKKEFKAN